jgi:hypothetical protein
VCVWVAFSRTITGRLHLVLPVDHLAIPASGSRPSQPQIRIDWLCGRLRLRVVCCCLASHQHSTHHPLNLLHGHTPAPAGTPAPLPPCRVVTKGGRGVLLGLLLTALMAFSQRG